jgi:imidazolonepropionase
MDPAGPELRIIENAAILAKDGVVTFAGPGNELPDAGPNRADVFDCGARLVTPGLIDCHTHLVHAGDRAHEFELRLAGAGYEEISRAGGGIMSSVCATRAASVDDLVRQALPRLDALMAEGVTTVEIKSGYGLELEAEKRQLRAARRLGELRPISIATTFLGAHALPPEANGDKDTYIRLVAEEMLPALAAEGLVDAVDGFCEGIAFSPAQIATVFDAAKGLGLPVKLHAEQLSNLGGAALAASYGALSADHLEYLDEAGAGAMSKSGTVAVLLPGAFLFHPREAGPSLGPAAPLRGALSAGDRQQSGDLAADLRAARRQHGGYSVPDDGCGMPRRDHAGSRARTWPA